MIRITGTIKYVPRVPSPTQLMSKKLRKAYLKRMRSKEYRRLKSIIPSVANKRKVDKVTVVEEAIRYIDHLHEVLSKKMKQVGFMQNAGANPAMMDMMKYMLTSGHVTAPMMPLRPCNRDYCKAMKQTKDGKS